MLDANSTRHHLLVGYDDWASCADARGVPLRDTWEASPPALNATGLEWDEDRIEIRLERKVFRFPLKQGDNPPQLHQRRGAAIDRYGNQYWVSDDRRSILVHSSGTIRTSVFWPLPELEVKPPGEQSDFKPLKPEFVGAPGVLSGLAITDDHYLIVGTLTPAGLLVFDLHAGGAPRELMWPADVDFTPFDLSARPGGGVWVLDREQKRLWALDGTLRIVAAGNALAPGAAFHFGPLDPAAESPQPEIGFVWQNAPLALAAADPIAVEGLPDCSVLVLDRNPGEPFSRIYHYTPEFVGVPPLSLDVVLNEIEESDKADFRLEAHDFVFVPELEGFEGLEYDRLFVVSSEGNQAFAFHLLRHGDAVSLRALENFYPLRLFGGMGLISGQRRVWYDFNASWIPIVEHVRPRYTLAATLHTLVLDGKELGCTWHRMMLDACIPPQTKVRIQSAAADDVEFLTSPAWEDEPIPYQRRRGTEQPFAKGHSGGTWELLFQKARGRYLRLRIQLEGDGRTTPRVRALRAYYPRFSYLRYLPAIYREDPVSASFVERYLANVEGMFTSLEDRIVAIQALFDPRTVPAEYLEWLSSWLGATLDPAWDETRKRLFLRYAMTFFQWRGTLRGLMMALRLALDECPDETIFTDPMRRSSRNQRIRIVEKYLTRHSSAVEVGDPTRGDAPAAVPTTGLWTPHQGAAALHARYRNALHLGSTAQFPIGNPNPATGQAAPAGWEDFCWTTLGFIPSAAASRGPQWQSFLARRYGRVSVLNQDWSAAYASFDVVPLPVQLPSAVAPLDDWYDFQRSVVATSAYAHRFTVLTPAPSESGLDLAAFRERLELVRRIVEMEKPAHTSYDLRFYWSLFRVGEARLGLDTEVDLGSRSPSLLSAALLGYAHLAESYLAPSHPHDVLARQVLGRDPLDQTASFRQENHP